MKAKLLISALVAALGVTGVNAAQASDGTITFTGTVVATSCVIGGSGASFTVALPPVDKNALAAAGNIAAPTLFPLVLTGCPASTAVHALFEVNNTSLDSATGALKNLAATGPAANVEVQILNSTLNPINIATGANNGAGSGGTTSAAGALTLNYYAQYYATGAAGSGAVSTNVTYALVYN